MTEVAKNELSEREIAALTKLFTSDGFEVFRRLVSEDLAAAQFMVGVEMSDPRNRDRNLHETSAAKPAARASQLRAAMDVIDEFAGTEPAQMKLNRLIIT